MSYLNFSPYGTKERSDKHNRYVRGRAYPRWANSGPIRTREEAPYAYSAFITHGPLEQIRGDDISGCYSDRLRSWISEDDWRAAWDLMPHKHYANLSLADISRFLSRCLNKKVECLQVLEGCNVSNGYPYWYFTYRLPASAMSAQQGQDPQGLEAQPASAVPQADAQPHPGASS